MKIENRELYIKRQNILKKEVTVYPVSCEKLCAGRTDYEWLDAVLAGGAKIVQLRDKDSDDQTLLKKAKYFREKTREHGALFLVNDRVDIGLLSDADGIHVGQGDMPVEEIRRIAPDWIIGLSCNSLEQVQELGRQVEAGKSSVSYYNLGPIYETKTKEGLQTFIGPEQIQSISAHCSLPFTVMGGIKFDHIEELTAAGARRLAVVTALSQADDMIKETDKWVRAIMTHVAKQE